MNKNNILNDAFRKISKVCQRHRSKIMQEATLFKPLKNLIFLSQAGHEISPQKLLRISFSFDDFQTFREEIGGNIVNNIIL